MGRGTGNSGAVDEKHPLAGKRRNKSRLHGTQQRFLDRSKAAHEAKYGEDTVIITPTQQTWYKYDMWSLDDDFITTHLHRDDGPAVVVRFEGEEYDHWMQNDDFHREGEPAVVYYEGCDSEGAVERYYFKGILHREDGPAITFADGRQQWFVEGIQLSDEQVAARTGQ